MALSSIRFTIFFFFFFIWLSVNSCFSKIEVFEIRNDDQFLIPIDEFGFTRQGALELNVSQFSYSCNYSHVDLSLLGFFLCSHEAWPRVVRQINDGEIICPLDSDLVKPVLTFHPCRTTESTLLEVSNNHEDSDDPHQYTHTLLFVNCHKDLNISMDVRSAMYNLAGNRREYLPVGEKVLPRIYNVFSSAHFALAGLWTRHLLLRRGSTKRLVVVNKTHFSMLAVLVVNALYLLSLAEQKSSINRNGTMNDSLKLFSDVLGFLTATTLGTSYVFVCKDGSSFLKAYLLDKAKNVSFVVLTLQIMALITPIMIQISGAVGIFGLKDYWFMTWENQVIFLVQVLVFLAVLFGIVWSMRKLRELAAKTDCDAAADAAATDKLAKLRLLRWSYTKGMCIGFFACVVLSASDSMIKSYKYVWTRVIASELVTLVSYVFVGYMCKPVEAQKLCPVIEHESKEDAAEPLMKKIMV